MIIPPILDVFSVWHPGDDDGLAQFDALHDHFHSAAFSGLAGGAVEVYPRSEPWGESGSPRPLGIESPLAEGVQVAQFNVVVVFVDVNLVREVSHLESEWHSYVKNISDCGADEKLLLIPVVAKGVRWENTELNRLLGRWQAIRIGDALADSVLCREVTQAIAQSIEMKWSGRSRLKVFVSHTKHRSGEEAEAGGPALFENVRTAISDTHLSSFFDAVDIQVGSVWQETLVTEASGNALLMIRTDSYSGRDWTQREVHAAKKSGMPVVSMYALTSGEARGSFLMDHVPSVACDLSMPSRGIRRALDRLVDEVLKSVLWRAQTSYLIRDGFDWIPAQSPEPTTLVPWLIEHRRSGDSSGILWVLHPDPPMGWAEREVLADLCRISGADSEIEILTPRTFAARGGVIDRG